MSAPPIGMISSTPKSSASAMMTGNASGAHGAVGCVTTSRRRAARPRPSSGEVDDVLQRVGHRPLRDPLDLLQLAGGHQAAGERQVAEEDLGDDRGHAERRELLAALAEPEVELGRADQPGRQAAEGVRERGPLRHRRERHRARAARRPTKPARIGDDDPAVVDDLGLGPGRQRRRATMPATPAYTPRRAVAGSFIQCSEKMKSAVATR